MEKITGMFQKKKTPKEQVREWQSRLRSEQRDLDRQIRGGSGHSGALGFYV